MAGLYDRLRGNDNVSVHTFMAALALRAEGEINNAQTKTIINDRLANNLTDAEIIDADAILSVLNSKGTAELKMRYYLKVDAANMIVSHGASLATESNWRSILEIV